LFEKSRALGHIFKVAGKKKKVSDLIETKNVRPLTFKAKKKSIKK